MFSELLPFWTKYWYHVLIGIISCGILRVFYVISRKGAVFIKNDKRDLKILNNTTEQLEGNTPHYCHQSWICKARVTESYM